MARGVEQLEVRHSCGEVIPVAVHWSYHPGTREIPPDYDEDITYYNGTTEHNCKKCGEDLDVESFYNAILEAHKIHLHSTGTTYD